MLGVAQGPGAGRRGVPRQAVVAPGIRLGDTWRVTGRTTQLGRQLRKLRHIAGGQGSGDPATTLRRATQLARDLACEYADVEDATAGFQALSDRGVLEPALAARLATWVASPGTAAELAMPIGGDLDRFLRSLELGAPAPEIPFDAIVAREAPAVPERRPDSTAAVTISGRVVEIEERGGRAVISVDERPLPMTLDSGELVTSFAIPAAPQSRAEVHREPTGVTRVVWSPENMAIEIAPDFASARIEARLG